MSRLSIYLHSFTPIKHNRRIKSRSLELGRGCGIWNIWRTRRKEMDRMQVNRSSTNPRHLHVHIYCAPSLSLLFCLRLFWAKYPNAIPSQSIFKILIPFSSSLFSCLIFFFIFFKQQSLKLSHWLCTYLPFSFHIPSLFKSYSIFPSYFTKSFCLVFQWFHFFQCYQKKIFPPLDLWTITDNSGQLNTVKHSH